MSTTVTYKGNTLTTATNQTRTLETAGKYLEDDITIVDVTSGGQPTLQSKTVTYTPTESQQTATITADSGYDGLNEVDITVGAISSTYVGSEVPEAEISLSTDTVDVLSEDDTYPAVINSSMTKWVPIATNTVSVSVNPSTGIVTATSVLSDDGNTGYGMYSAGILPRTETGTLQLTTQAATTITPTESQQTAVAANVFTTGAVTVAAMPTGTATAPTSISGTSATVSTGTNTLTLTKTVSVTPRVTTAGYVSAGTAGNASVSLTANVTTQAAQTIHPSTSDQSIAASRYLTGTQTIKGVTVSGLSADKILSGTTVKIGDSTDDDCVTSVAGNVVIVTYYVSNQPPSASVGNDGDIWLVSG